MTVGRPPPQLSSILTVVDQEAELLDHGQVPGDPVEAVTVQPCNTQRRFQLKAPAGVSGDLLNVSFHTLIQRQPEQISLFLSSPHELLSAPRTFV